MKVDLVLMAISKYLIKIPQSLRHFDMLTYVLWISFHKICKVRFLFNQGFFLGGLSWNKQTVGKC